MTDKQTTAQAPPPKPAQAKGKGKGAKPPKALEPGSASRSQPTAANPDRVAFVADGANGSAVAPRGGQPGPQGPGTGQRQERKPRHGGQGKKSQQNPRGSQRPNIQIIRPTDDGPSGSVPESATTSLALYNAISANLQQMSMHLERRLDKLEADQIELSAATASRSVETVPRAPREAARAVEEEGDTEGEEEAESVDPTDKEEVIVSVSPGKKHIAWLEKHWPEYKPKPASKSGSSEHTLMRIDKELAEHRVLNSEHDSFTLKHAFGSATGAVVDIGGNPLRHHKMNRSRIWSCCPIVCARDTMRNNNYARYPQLKGKFCNHLVQECTCVPMVTAYLSVHSLYYLTPEIVLALVNKAEQKRLVAIHHNYPVAVGYGVFPPETKGNDVEAAWERASATISTRVRGNPVPYLHANLDWLQSGIFSDGNTVMEWNTTAITPLTYVTLFVASSRTPADVPPIPSAVTMPTFDDALLEYAHNPVRGPVDMRGYLKKGEVMDKALDDLQTCLATDEYFLFGKLRPVKVPRGAIDSVAAQLSGQPKHTAATRNLATQYSRSYLMKANMNESEMSRAIPIVAVLGLLRSAQYDSTAYAAMHTAATPMGVIGRAWHPITKLHRRLVKWFYGSNVFAEYDSLATTPLIPGSTASFGWWAALDTVLRIAGLLTGVYRLWLWFRGLSTPKDALSAHWTASVDNRPPRLRRTPKEELNASTMKASMLALDAYGLATPPVASVLSLDWALAWAWFKAARAAVKAGLLARLTSLLLKLRPLLTRLEMLKYFGTLLGMGWLWPRLIAWASQALPATLLGEYNTSEASCHNELLLHRVQRPFVQTVDPVFPPEEDITHQGLGNLPPPSEETFRLVKPWSTAAPIFAPINPYVAVATVCCKGRTMKPIHKSATIKYHRPKESWDALCKPTFGGQPVLMVCPLTPVMPRSCLHNQELAIVNRVLMDRSPATDTMNCWDAFFRYWAVNAERHFGPKPRLAPMPIDTWLARFPAPRRAVLKRSYENWQFHSSNVDLRQERKCATFVKKEMYLKHTPFGTTSFDPRAIQGKTDTHQLKTGPFCVAESKWMSRVWGLRDHNDRRLAYADVVALLDQAEFTRDLSGSVKSVSSALANYHFGPITYAAGLDADGIGMWLERAIAAERGYFIIVMGDDIYIVAHTREGVVIICIDTNRWDARFGLCAHAVGRVQHEYAGATGECFDSLASQSETHGVTSDGIEYSVVGGIQSGTGDTSVKNSGPNGMQNAWALEGSGLVLADDKKHVVSLRSAIHQILHVPDTNYPLAIQWDPMVQSSAAPIVPANMLTVDEGLARHKAAIESLGWDIDYHAWVEGRADNLINVGIMPGDFCSGYFWPSSTGYKLGPKPGRLLPKLFWSKEPRSLAERLKWAREVATGLVKSCNHIPVVRAVLRRVLELTEPIGKVEATMPQFQFLSSRHSEPVPATYLMLHHLYGASADSVEALERKILCIPSLPWALSDPLLTRMCEVDNETDVTHPGPPESYVLPGSLGAANSNGREEIPRGWRVVRDCVVAPVLEETFKKVWWVDWFNLLPGNPAAYLNQLFFGTMINTNVVVFAELFMRIVSSDDPAAMFKRYLPTALLHYVCSVLDWRSAVLVHSAFNLYVYTSTWVTKWATMRLPTGGFMDRVADWLRWDTRIVPPPASLASLRDSFTTPLARPQLIPVVEDWENNVNKWFESAAAVYGGTYSDPDWWEVFIGPSARVAHPKAGERLKMLALAGDCLFKATMVDLFQPSADNGNTTRWLADWPLRNDLMAKAMVQVIDVKGQPDLILRAKGSSLGEHWLGTMFEAVFYLSIKHNPKDLLWRHLAELVLKQCPLPKEHVDPYTLPKLPSWLMLHKAQVQAPKAARAPQVLSECRYCGMNPPDHIGSKCPVKLAREEANAEWSGLLAARAAGSGAGGLFNPPPEGAHPGGPVPSSRPRPVAETDRFQFHWDTAGTGAATCVGAPLPGPEPSRGAETRPVCTLM